MSESQSAPITKTSEVTTPNHVLLLEDSDIAAELVKREVDKSGVAHKITRVKTREEFVRGRCNNRPDLILCDYEIPGFNAPAALEIVQKEHSGVPFIIVSGTIGEEVAIKAMKTGITDHILKDRLAPAFHASSSTFMEFHST